MYHSEIVRILVDLRGLVVTWSEVSWSLSSASTSIGVGAIGTTSCALLHTGWSDGSITSSSLHHPPTQFFREKPFLEKGPDSRNNPLLLLDLRQEVYPTVLGVLWRCIYLLWVRAYQPETFSHKHRSRKLLRNDSLGFSKPWFIRCHLNGIMRCPI